MVVKYDFHIHTALSPCAMNDMTPNNIVNMAIISELDVIAITDHNSCKNAGAVIDVAKGTDLLVIPGMEVETAEEVHAVCLFEELEQAISFQNIVYKHLPKIRNKKIKKKIFGNQFIMDKDDEIIGEESELLSFACSLSIDELIKIVDDLGGILIPAHVDRPSNSIISNLGEIPEYMGFKTIEISRFASKSDYKNKYSDKLIIQDSDSHELGFVGICENELEVEKLTPKMVISKLKGV